MNPSAVIALIADLTRSDDLVVALVSHDTAVIEGITVDVRKLPLRNVVEQRTTRSR